MSDRVYVNVTAEQANPNYPLIQSRLPGEAGKTTAKARRAARGAKRIKVLRIVQSFLSAILSLAIAAFQGKVYFQFQKTKDAAGAWPTYPNVVPTLLMFSVAIAALVFDACMLVAYTWPRSRFARWAVTIGGAAHSVVTSSKTVGFAIGAVISKTSYDYGNNSGQTADLWSWTCSDAASAPSVDPLIQGGSNCATQEAAWVFALAQLFLEVLGWIITILEWRQPSEPLSAQAMEERFTAYSADVGGKLADVTPHFDLST